jgi:hypothetical protein
MLDPAAHTVTGVNTSDMNDIATNSTPTVTVTFPILFSTPLDLLFFVYSLSALQLGLGGDTPPKQ